MSYRLKKPLTNEEQADFIFSYGRQQKMLIREGSDTYTEDELTCKADFIFALEPNEMMAEEEVEIDVPDFETVTEEYSEPVYIEVPIIDPETGEEIGTELVIDHYETKTSEVIRPIMIEYEDTETVVDYDEEGNPIGTHEITAIKHKQQTHKETTTVCRPIINPHYEEEQAEKERIRIANLHMTRGDVFRGLLLAKGVTRADMRGLIEAMPEETPEQKIAKEYALIDFDEALEFYRGVTLIDTVGEQLGITPTQMDRFFDTKDWHELVNEEQNEN